MKLAAKVTTLLVLGFIVLILVNGYLAYRREIAIFERDWIRDAREHAQDSGVSLLHVWREEGEDRAFEMIEKMNQQGRLSMRIVWTEAPPDHPNYPVARNKLVQLMSWKDEKCLFSEHEDENLGTMRLAYVKMTNDLWPDRTEALEFREPVDEVRAAFRDFTIRTCVLTSVTLLLGGVFAGVLGHEMVAKPLKQLIDKTRRIGKGDLSKPLTLRGWDEFGELAASLNAMCEQLGEAQEKLKREAEERVKATEQLRHAERLQMVGQLASGIAHELGTPLNVVSGRAGMIASGKLSPEDTKENAEIIKSETERITKTIRQLMDFARRKTPQKKPTDLREIVSQLVELVDPLAEQGNYTISVPEDDQTVTATVDVGQIQQVLTNLLANAAHSMPDGGHIEVGFLQRRTRRPAATEANTAPYVGVSVRDHGHGISEENMKNIFEPFFTTKEVGKGTGLGLSISHGIVHEHGGWIDVQSEVGEGSCFTVYLPAEVDQCTDES